MAAVIILNVLLAVLVIGGMLALLGWSIASDRVVAAKLIEHRRAAHARRRATAPRFSAGYSRSSAYPRGA